MLDPTITIAGRTVGPSHPAFIIAEAGVNHNGDPALAHRLVDAAAIAGADAVKFQTFRAELVATESAEKAQYQAAATGAAENQLAMLRRLELSPDVYGALAARARAQGIVFLSTAFDEESLILLLSLGVPALKIPSGEITNLPFLRCAAGSHLPLVMSTGMSTLGEVEQAVECVTGEGNRAIALLHCTSQYPAPYVEVNLRAMRTLAQAFGGPVGYSDHTQGIEVALAAVALGACIVEKHFTLDRTLPGPDHRASIEPNELAQLVRSIGHVECALGTPQKRPAPSEVETRALVRRSLVARTDIAAGTVLSESMLVAKRPAGGVEPRDLDVVVGRVTVRPLRRDQPLTWEDLMSCGSGGQKRVLLHPTASSS